MRKIRVYDPLTGEVKIYPDLPTALKGENIPKGKTCEMMILLRTGGKVYKKYWSYLE